MQSGISWSAHFLKYAALASYLRPKVSSPELISALIVHFPTVILRSCATVRRDGVQDAVELLQRLEAIEGKVGYTEQATAGNNHYVSQTCVSRSQNHSQNQRSWHNSPNYGRYDNIT
jgi:cbb3-type cytochrome oxidase cytochrome c subunit